MTPKPLPELAIDSALKSDIDVLARTLASVEDAEALALAGELARTLQDNRRWRTFCETVGSVIQERGYIIARGLNVDEGRSLLIASTALNSRFDTYQPTRIVKRFRMSPWTKELSHTIRAGDFHTDGNVSDEPPGSTAMQCEIEDPGAPQYAEQRVAHLPDLLERLGSGNSEDQEALAFLTDSQAEMAHERSPKIWTGRLVQDGVIRYHPQSLRVACRRRDAAYSQVEALITAVHRAALDVSQPFHTRPGDVLLVSNRTTLHYRGACSVKFTRFPTEFISRSLLVLHLKTDLECRPRGEK